MISYGPTSKSHPTTGKEKRVRNLLLRRGVPLLAAALVCLIVPAPAEAQWSADESGSPEPAAVSVFSSGIDFAPTVSYRRAILTIAGGDTSIRNVFAAGERPTIELYDAEGNYLADGPYTWKLEFVPDAETAQALRVAASRNKGKAPGAWEPQTGSFAIVSGSIAAPDVAEAMALRTAEGSDARLETHMARGSFGAASSGMALDSDAAGASEGDARSAAAATAESGAARQALSRVGTGDTDGDAMALGRSLEAPAEAIQNFSSSRGGSIAHRTTDPDGKNGRPTGDK